jgi:SAM-dependent methyltransferase
MLPGISNTFRILKAIGRGCDQRIAGIRRASASRRADHGALVALLQRLYAQQGEQRPRDDYLRGHARPAVVQTQVAVFHFYARWLPARGRILDWGCRHAPDACLARARFGPALRIDGCDFVQPGQYDVFHRYARLDYLELDDVVRLPYESDSFDAVIASGTLEHVAMDYESLKELYRVLRPEGRLIITYLPNLLSYEEWVKRRRGAGFHRRLYGLGDITRLLRRTGFLPLVSGYQTRLDCLPARSPLHHLLRTACWVVPLHRFASTLCLVAAKVQSM